MADAPMLALVRESMATVSLSGPSGSAAKRTLKMLAAQDAGIQCTEGNQKLVAALKLCAAGNLNIENFKKFKSLIEVRESVEQKLFIVEKTARPNLDQTEGFIGYGEESSLHHPDTVKTSVDKARYWFIDQSCPRLPKGALAIRASISQVHHGEPGAAGPALEFKGPPTEAEPVRTMPSVQATPPQATAEAGAEPRRLQKEDSETMSDMDFQLYLTQKAKDTIAAELYFHEDPNEPTVHSLLRRFKVYIEACVAKKGDGQQTLETIPVPMQDFFKFMLKSLVQKPSFGWIGSLAEELEGSLKMCPELSKGTGQALLAVHKSKLDAPEEVDLSFLDFKQDTFFRCTEYFKSYLVQRRAALAVLRAERLAELRNATEMEMPRRLEKVDILRKGVLLEEEYRELLFAKTMLSSISEGAKCKYLLHTEGVAANMAIWFPKDPKVDIMRFFVQGVKYKEERFEDFLRAAEFIVGMGHALVAEVPNPVVRGMLNFYAKARERQSASESTIQNMPQKLLQELACVKLSMPLPVDHGKPDVPQQSRKDAAEIYQLLEVVWRKVPLPIQQQCHWTHAAHQCAEEVQGKDSQPTAGKPGEGVQGQEDQTKAEKPVAEESAPAASSTLGLVAPAASAVMPAPIIVGSLVKVNMPGKTDFHNFAAEVKGVLAKTYQVVMTEGPKAGENTKLDKAKVSLKTTAESHPEEPAAKAAKVAALASAVQAFGSLEDM
jgi:hypothetical protein